jgi:arabinogalactan oligomer/maltooligosaccharide transport system substrate-binding protein
MEENVDRRTLLRVGGPAAVALLAGCASESDDGDDEEDDEDDTQSSPEVTVPEGVEPTETKPDGPEEITTTEIREPTIVTVAPPDDSGEETTPPPEDDSGGETDQPVEASGEVTLWHARTNAGAQLFERATQQWAADSDSEVLLSQVPGSTFQAKLQSAIPSGEGPMLFEWSHDRAGVYESSGFLSDQGDSLDLDDETLFEMALDASGYDGKRIGVPWSAETVALYYNEDMVDSPPETLAEMQAIMDEHHDPTNGTYGLGFPVNPYYASGFAQAYGEEVYNGEEDTLGIASDEVIRGLSVFMNDLAPYMPDDPGTGTQLSVFREGNAPFYISGPWEVPGLRSEDIDFGVTTLPTLPDGGQPRPYAGVRLLYFAAKMDRSENAAAGRTFAEWFATDERNMLSHANQGRYVPVHTGLVGSGQLPDTVAAFAEQLRDAYPMPQNPKMDQVWGPFGDAVTQTFNGNGDIESNLQTAEEAIRDAWADN